MDVSNLEPVVTADAVYRFVSDRGFAYQLNTVYKTMRRMSERSDTVEWIGGGFRLRATLR